MMTICYAVLGVYAVLVIIGKLYAYYVEKKLNGIYARENRSPFFTQQEFNTGYIPSNSEVPFYLLIHGFDDGPVVYRDIAPYLRRCGYGYFAIQLAGTGAGYIESGGVTNYQVWLREIQNIINFVSSRFKDLRLVGLSMGAVLAHRSAALNATCAENSIKKMYLINPAFGTSLSFIDRFHCRISTPLLYTLLGWRYGPDLTTTVQKMYAFERVETRRGCKFIDFTLCKNFCGVAYTPVDKVAGVETKIILSRNDEKLDHSFLEGRSYHVCYVNSDSHVVTLDSAVVTDIVKMLDIPTEGAVLVSTQHML